jgi:hypothetical protein
MQTPARGKPLGVLTYWVVAMLAVTAVIDILGVASLLIERSLVLDSLAGRPVSIDEAVASDNRVEAIGGWTLIALLVTGVLWCIWQHRAHGNLRAFGRNGLRYTPGWAVGWWFIPFASLWKPLGAMSELWKSSEPTDDPNAWLRARAWWLLGLWWACWIGGNLLDVVASAMQQESDLSTVASSDIVAVVARLVEITAAICAVVILRDILGRQRALASMSWAAPLPPPLPGLAGAPPMPPPPPSPPPPLP